MQELDQRRTTITITIPDWRKQGIFYMIALSIVNALLLLLLGIFTITYIQQDTPSSQTETIIYLLLALLFIIFCATIGLGIIMQDRRKKNDASIAKSAKELKRRITQLQVAAEIARDVSDTFDLDRILNRTVNLVRERFGFYHAGIFLIDDTGEYAILRAAEGPSSKIMLENNHKLRVGHQGVVGHATNLGRSYVAWDVKEDAKHYKNPVLMETRSEVAIPLKIGERVIGALDVQSTQEKIFDDTDIEILQTLADLLAIAIDKADAYEREHKHSEELNERTKELTLVQARLQAILDSMGEGVIYTNENGKVEYINSALTRIFKLDNYESNIMKKIKELFTSSVNLNTSVVRAVKEQNVWRDEVTVNNSDGSITHAGITSTAVFDEGNYQNYRGIVTVVRDITQEKELHEQKARFVANASHELRTPITNFLTQVYLMRRNPADMPRYIDTMDYLSRHMKRLVEDLLDLSRFESGTIELNKSSVIVQKMITDIVDMQRAEGDQKAIEITTIVPEEPLVAFIDEDRMAQVITNLVTNAIRYTPDKGHIIVSVEDQSSHILIGVKDNGLGIAKEHLDQLFQPFFRVSKDKIGSGLGLSIAKTIVEQHNGDIIVNSTLGEGSHFQIKLLV